MTDLKYTYFSMLSELPMLFFFFLFTLEVRKQVFWVCLWVLFLWVVLREARSSLTPEGCEGHGNDTVPASMEYRTALQNE